MKPKHHGEDVGRVEYASGQTLALQTSDFLRQEPLYPNTAREQEGGLSRAERADLLERVAEEFGWLPLTEVGERVHIRDPWDVQRMPPDLLGVYVDRGKIMPGFALDGSEVSEAVLYAARQ